MPLIDVYSRRGCHLCELLIDELIPLVRDRARVTVHDVDTDPRWRARYGDDVPVVVFGGRELCRHRLDADAVTGALAAG